MKLLKIAALAGMLVHLTTPAFATEKTEREILIEKLSPYGDRGQRLIQTIDLYAEKCDLQGSEISILLYLGATTHGNGIKKTALSAKDNAALEALIQRSDCPI